MCLRDRYTQVRVTTRHRRESVRTCVCSATSHIWHLAKRNGLALQRRPRHAGGFRRLQGEGAERGGLAARSTKEVAHLLRPIRLEAPAPRGRHLQAKAKCPSGPDKIFLEGKASGSPAAKNAPASQSEGSIKPGQNFCPHEPRRASPVGPATFLHTDPARCAASSSASPIGSDGSGGILDQPSRLKRLEPLSC